MGKIVVLETLNSPAGFEDMELLGRSIPQAQSTQG
jgi:hypothetical protein